MECLADDVEQPSIPLLTDADRIVLDDTALFLKCHFQGFRLLNLSIDSLQVDGFNYNLQWDNGHYMELTNEQRLLDWDVSLKFIMEHLLYVGSWLLPSLNTDL